MNNNILKCLYYMLSQSFHIFAFLIIVCVSMIILVREMKPLHDMFRKSRYFTPVHFVLTNVKESGLTLPENRRDHSSVKWYRLLFCFFPDTQPILSAAWRCDRCFVQSVKTLFFRSCCVMVLAPSEKLPVVIAFIPEMLFLFLEAVCSCCHGAFSYSFQKNI